jgi:hypothetical protein
MTPYPDSSQGLACEADAREPVGLAGAQLSASTA